MAQRDDFITFLKRRLEILQNPESARLLRQLEAEQAQKFDNTPLGLMKKAQVNGTLIKR